MRRETRAGGRSIRKCFETRSTCFDRRLGDDDFFGDSMFSSSRGGDMGGVFGAFGRDPFFSDVGGVFGRRRSMFDRDSLKRSRPTILCRQFFRRRRRRRRRARVVVEFDDDDDDDRRERCSTNANGEETDTPGRKRRGGGGGGARRRVHRRRRRRARSRGASSERVVTRTTNVARGR